MKISKKQSLLYALLVSLGIALLGSVLWGLIYSFGYLVSIIAYVSAFGAFFMYNYFAHKTDWLSFTWVLFWVIVFNSVATIISLIITISAEYGISLGESIDVFNIVIKDVEVYGAVIKDLILGILFAVLGVGTCFYVFKKNKQVAEQKIMELIESTKKANEEKKQNDLVKDANEEQPEIVVEDKQDQTDKK